MNDFHRTLHELALQASEDFTDEGTEGDPYYELRYSGQILGNYPWLYLDFNVYGAMPLGHLVQTEARIREACEKSPGLANFLSSTLGAGIIRYRLIYRQDLKSATSGD